MIKSKFFLGFSVLTIAVCSITSLYAATCTSTSAGNWNTSSNWSCGAVPSGSDVIIVNHAMTLGSATFSAWSGTLSITINSGGSLKVTGNLTLEGPSMNVIIKSGGSLEVTGTLVTQNGGAKVSVNNGGILKAGTLAVNYASRVDVGAGSTATIGTLTTSSNNDAFFNNSGTTNISGSVSSSGVMNNYGIMNVSGNLSQNNSGNTFTNSGIVTVTGNVVANGKIQLNPGVSTDSRMLVNGDFTVTANENLVIGTSVNPPNYTDLVIKKNLIMSGSGDVTVNKNGRVAVFGSITDSGGGGTLLTLNAGGQMYVDGNINFSGGGNSIANNNSTSPYGLYVNGTTTNSGGGSTTTTNTADKATMQNTNPAFANWIAMQGGALPVSLLYFKAKENTPSGIVLNWVTITELNFDYFEIERSTNGIDFQPIGEVKGNGTTSLRHEYTWKDIAPVVGKNYYRLKSIDFDKYTEYFNIVTVNSELKKNAAIYPNPVNDGFVHVDLTFNPGEKESIVFITDLSGSVVLSQQVNERSFILPLIIPPGVYIISVISGDFKSISRLLVR